MPDFPRADVKTHWGSPGARLLWGSPFLWRSTGAHHHLAAPSRPPRRPPRLASAPSRSAGPETGPRRRQRLPGLRASEAWPPGPGGGLRRWRGAPPRPTDQSSLAQICSPRSPACLLAAGSPPPRPRLPPTLSALAGPAGLLLRPR